MKIFQWDASDERERAKVGDQAEMYVRQVLSEYGSITFLRGPLVPNIDTYGRINGYRETDFLVYTQGTVFCIEVKNYAGTITYVPRFAPQTVWNGYGHTQQNVFAGYDITKILQRKPGNAGTFVERTYPNPLKKTRSFIALLKRYVGRIEPRFLRLFIVPVVCFNQQADIRGIYNFQEGMISIEQLPAFLYQHRREQFAGTFAPWISETILHKIPNWDRVLTTRGEWVNGILMEPHLTFLGLDNQPYSLPNYATVRSIHWQHTTDRTHMTVTYTNGATQIFPCKGGQLSLIRGEHPETFPFQHLQQLVIGLANKMAL